MIAGFVASIIVTYGTWFIIHTYYAPHHLPAYLTFLAPRTWPWISDIPTSPFHQWAALPIVTFIFLTCIITGYWFALSKKITFRKFCVILYFLCLMTVTSFLYLTPNGIGHIALQAKSGMNVIWLPLHYLNNFTPEFNRLSTINQIRYIYTVPGATYAKLTYAGSSHPPMFTIIGFALYLLAKILMTPFQESLTVHGIHYIAFGWGIIVTLVNSFLVVAISYIASLLYSERIGRLTGVLVLTMPSVVFHICEVMEGIPTVSLAFGILLLLVTLNNFSKMKFLSSAKNILTGVLTGTCFTISAQFSYGFAVPIVAFLLAFLINIYSFNRRRLFIYLLGVSIPAIIYFIFEYIISSGHSFWIVRSIVITNELNMLLEKFRPYPISQVANFVVMSVMGGLLWLPIILATAFTWIKAIVLKLRHRTGVISHVPLLRRFFSLAVFLCLIYLVFQRAVRLEVERTWFWFFFPVWSLSGMYLEPINRFVRQIVTKHVKIPTKNPFLYLIIIQAIISIVLATQIQDYY